MKTMISNAILTLVFSMVALTAPLASASLSTPEGLASGQARAGRNGRVGPSLAADEKTDDKKKGGKKAEKTDDKKKGGEKKEPAPAGGW